jgi:hypothetical protein
MAYEGMIAERLSPTFGDFETTIILSTGSGNGKSPSSRARGDRGRQLTAPQR